jgi:hypothetical protein
MKRIAAIFFIVFSVLRIACSQGEIDDEEKIFYRNERTFVVSLNTNGIDGGFRYAKRIDAFLKTIYEAEFAFVKDPKETKISSIGSYYYYPNQTGNRYVYGKLNSLASLRGGIGLQKEIFRKQDKGGISIRYFYLIGPAIGFVKPYYYDFLTVEYDNTGGQRVILTQVTFEEHMEILQIIDNSNFYVGLLETKIVPGLYGKFGFTFEFSKKDMTFNAFEIGVKAEAYIKKIPIMANDNNTWFFPAFYLSYRFGKVIDSQFKTGKNKIDELLTD